MNLPVALAVRLAFCYNGSQNKGILKGEPKMKKIFAALLAAVLLLGAACALAEGTMTDKPINFAEFTFGDTFGNIRKQIKMDSISFEYYPISPRMLADVNEYAVSWFSDESSEALGFQAYIREQRDVAGHEAQMNLRFVYPESGAADNDAVFYAGCYSFYEWNEKVSEVWNDLNEKLKKLYGEPFYEGNKVSEALGTLPLEESQLTMYEEEEANASPTYTIWKSSANGGMVVLKYYTQFDSQYLELIYVDENAEALFASENADTSDSMQGL